MAVDKKSKSLWEPGRRFALWLIWSCVFSLCGLVVLWSVDDWIDRPLARLVFSGVLVLGYGVIAFIMRRLFDAEGKRVTVQPVAEVETEANS